ncbi:hypothetical protein RUND412_006296 [Rhizina undulata]
MQKVSLGSMERFLAQVPAFDFLNEIVLELGRGLVNFDNLLMPGYCLKASPIDLDNSGTGFAHNKFPDGTFISLSSSISLFTFLSEAHNELINIGSQDLSSISV